MGSPYQGDEAVPQSIIDAAANAPPSPPPIPPTYVPPPEAAPSVATAPIPSPTEPRQAIPAPLASGPTGQPATPSRVAPGAATSGARALPDVGTPAPSAVPDIGAPAPAAGSAPSTGAGDGSVPFDPNKVLAVGDSLTAHLSQYSGVPGGWSGKVKNYQPGNTSIAGADPTGIFDLINDIPESRIKGQNVVLSTGASNIGGPMTPKDVAAIVHQIDLLRTKGANSITVMGVGTAVDPRTNGALGRIARDNGAIFSGPLDPKNLSDGIHAKNYNQVRDQIYGVVSSTLGGGQRQASSVELPLTPAPLPVGPDGQPIQRLPSIQQTALPTGTTPQGQGGQPQGQGQQQAPIYNPGSDPRGKVPVLRAAAQRYGINPDLMVLASAQEGLFVFKGDANSGGSYGAMQLNMMPGSVGDKMLRETGIDPRLPQNEDATIDYAARYIAQHGWGEWNGPKKIGITGKMGIGGNPVPADIFTRSYRSGGRGGAPAYGPGSQGGGGGDSSGVSLARFQQHVQNKDAQGFLTDVAATQTPTGFDGWMAKWMTSQNRTVLDAIHNGHPEQVAAIEDAYTRMGYQGMNQNLMNMYQALQRGDVNSAAGYGSLAYSYFPDGAHVTWKTDGQGNLFAQRIGEASGKPLGDAIPVTPDTIMKQMRFTSNPETFQKFLATQQAASMKAQLDAAHASYFKELNNTRERMNQLTRQSEIQRSIITGEYGLARARESGANKAETGLLTEQQKDTMLKAVDEELQSTGLPNGVKVDNTPEGNQLRQKLSAVSRSVLNRSNRMLSAPDVVSLVKRIAMGEYKVDAARDATGNIDPKTAVIVDGKTGMVVAPIDMSVAQQYLGYNPQKQQAAPPTAKQPQAVPAGP